jgi:hypothetical protein
MTDPVISLAGQLTFDVPAAVDTIHRYNFRETVRIYDLGAEAGASSKRAVTLADIGRLVVINAELQAGDVVRLLSASADVDRLALPEDADLADADPAETGGLYDRMSSLYEVFTGLFNIKATKASKLLHIKWPSAFPIMDKYARDRYEQAGQSALAEYPNRQQPGVTCLRWAAMRKDLIASRPALAHVRAALPVRDEWGATLATLSDLRLIDMLIWSAKDQ